jgi:transposase InsO family protein
MAATSLPDGPSVQAACAWFGITRQAYYQARQRQISRAAEDELLVQMVQALRQDHARMGTRKLYHEIKPQMDAMGIQRGRDALFDLLGQYDLLVPHKRSLRRTTFSGHWHFTNRLTDLTITHINQVWVADITYLCTEQGHLYLALLTDVFSRYIVGFDLSPSLATEGALRSLNQALKNLPQPPPTSPTLIHHSDHGIQYLAHLYLDRLADFHIQSSMGQIGNCYDNALAERVNGILKLEYGLDSFFVTAAQAQSAVRQAVHLYNHHRPHLALDYRKPAQLYHP